jgi:hypothetical protein
MIKTLFATAVLGLALASPSFAADKMKMSHCDAGTMTMMMDAIKKDTDPKMAKDAAMAGKEMHMAEMSMKKHNMKECAMHIDMAKKHMMMH